MYDSELYSRNICNWVFCAELGYVVGRGRSHHFFSLFFVWLRRQPEFIVPTFALSSLLLHNASIHVFLFFSTFFLPFRSSSLLLFHFALPSTWSWNRVHIFIKMEKGDGGETGRRTVKADGSPLQVFYACTMSAVILFFVGLGGLSLRFNWFIYKYVKSTKRIHTT